MSKHELRAKRGTTYDAFVSLANKADFNPSTDDAEFKRLKGELEAIDAQIKRIEEAEALESKTALPAPGQDGHAHKTWAQPKSDPWTHEESAKAAGFGTHKGLVFGGVAKMIGMGNGSVLEAREHAKQLYGESHPVTKALLAGVGAAGGFIVPPDYVNEIIEVLRPMAVVRSAGPRVLPMPRGTLTLPAQTQAATSTYGGEVSQIAASQQQVGQIIATYKKQTSLVPVSNDLMRYANPAADAFVRDDLVKVMALREDLAFLVGDGLADSPRGYTSFANSYATANGGTAGIWSSSANPTLASGGNFITSNETYTLATAAAELGGLVNKLDTANVPDLKRCWFMHPRTWNYLNNVQNSLGVYVYRDELSKGTLLGYPFKKSTQIPINLKGSGGTNSDCSFIMLVEMTDDMILDSMSLELAVSREGSYVDANGATVSAFQKDQTIIRAIAEHDHQMRHTASIAVAQTVRWAPAIS